MPKIPTINGRQALRALERAGLEIVRIKGSHHFLRRSLLPSRSVTVPIHGNRDLPPGTLRAIIEQAGMSVDDFIELL